MSPSETSSSRCSQCTAGRESTRNLVVCIDGTSNQFGQNNTNVVKLFSQIDLESRSPTQCKFYTGGIGTHPKSSHIFKRVSDAIDMAVAWSVPEIVKDAYDWLARMYQEGDQIYFFGFSRGAYQVRVLAGMIYEVGLIRAPTEKQIIRAYDHYRATRWRRPEARQTAKEFKGTFSWEAVRVHFIGVWDTVSSVGLIRRNEFLSASSCAAHACHFRHALALDELRVKFIPEYFHDVNSNLGDRSVWCQSYTSDNGTGSSTGRMSKTPDIKEVWFAGSHSDVGGKDNLRKPRSAGNASLLWMRREAAERGLILKSTDVFLVPDDLDFGTRNSMTLPWKLVEHLPITHQVSFGGSGGNFRRRRHQFQPRRIIPGQKVHTSVLYASTYNPRATLGEGSNIHITRTDPEEAQPDDEFWDDSGLFNDVAADELVEYLGGDKEVAPARLNRLLFMLRLNGGKQFIDRINRVPDSQEKLRSFINHESDSFSLVKLIRIVVYYEAYCDPNCNPNELPENVFNGASEYFEAFRMNPSYPDGPSVLVLLRPMAKYRTLRKHILTNDVLKILMVALDVPIKQLGKKKPGVNFGRAMYCLNCLLQYEDLRETTINELGQNLPGSTDSRLSWILRVENPYLLTAALRMVLTLAKIPGETTRTGCSAVKDRIRELVKKYEGPVGALAAEILIALYNPDDPKNLGLGDSRFRLNLASALAHMNPDAIGGQGDYTSPTEQWLRNIFGVGTTELGTDQRRLLGGLKTAIELGNTRERTAATMTVLRLCETKVIRKYFNKINLLGVFIEQLQSKDAALLAAYALTICLEYDDMKELIYIDESFPKNIVKMLRLDYFDDAVVRYEGFDIFEKLMENVNLQKKIKECKIEDHDLDTIEVLMKRLKGKVLGIIDVLKKKPKRAKVLDVLGVLEEKLRKGKANEARISLVCLSKFPASELVDSWTKKLIDEGLKYLKQPVWKDQKAGVAILSTLARTARGEIMIKGRINEITEILLPREHMLTPPTGLGVMPASAPSGGQGQTQPTLTITEPQSFPQPRSFSWMLGPACALRVLAQNDKLRRCIRQSWQYAELKELFLGAHIGGRETRAWRVRTPNRSDVMDMLNKMIKVVDGESFGDYEMAFHDTPLPRIQHWNRFVRLVNK